MPNPTNHSGIRDNHRRGAVADFLKARILPGARLSVVSACFTIYAYDALKEHLDGTRDVDDHLCRVALPDTRIWRTLFSFQKDGAKAAINKILDYNGCILAAGEPAALERLCDQFDQRTRDGADMSHYDGLLQKALGSIERTFQTRAVGALLSSRSAVLPNAGETPRSDGADFDLVTWLVIVDKRER